MKKLKEIQMKEIKLFGEFEPNTMEQINMIKKSKAFEDETIAIMPDAHYGKGAPVGFTATFTDKLIVNLVGVDVGCGMGMEDLPLAFKNTPEHLQMLQTIIRKQVPHGMNVHKNMSRENHEHALNIFTDQLTFDLTGKEVDRISNSLGTLGGGNHFIEVNERENGKLVLVIHSGSRSLGLKVAEHHQAIARTNFIKLKPTKEQIDAVEPRLRGEFIKNFKSSKVDDTPEKDLEYLVGSQVDDYLNDMRIAQEFARENRNAMLLTIADKLIQELYENKPFSYEWDKEFFKCKDSITHTVHNYIDIENKIIRKGSIFADEENDVIIPLNMRDGSIIARGKGNKEANYSAPHGAGRIMSRTVAKNSIKLEDFKETMKGVTSWTINKNTLDEAPFAYKSKEFILENLKDLVEVKEVIKPIFNFKDDSEGINYRKKRQEAKGGNNE